MRLSHTTSHFVKLHIITVAVIYLPHYNLHIGGIIHIPDHTLQFEYGDKTVNELLLLFDDGQINLEPGFQRDSVWRLSDRKKLIESMLRHYPIPSIFLYQRSENGEIVYGVIDGKQRLETVLKFCGQLGRERFGIKFRMDGDEETGNWDWRKLQNKGYADRLKRYKFQTVEVKGDLSDIIDLFVRINSPGKMLTGAEKRHARYYNSPFLKQAGSLAEKSKVYFLENKILNDNQLTRMKHVEFVCELMASIQAKGLINKKKALDGVLGGDSPNLHTLNKTSNEFKRLLKLTKRIFPKIRETRFRNTAEFYSIFMLIWEMDRDGCVLSQSARNKQAQRLLRWMSEGVDMVKDQQRKAHGAKPEQRIFVDYLLTVQSDTGSSAQRSSRAAILRKIFGGLHERKDGQRGFTAEQRRLIWHSQESKKCPGCRTALSWNNFTIDHIKPHALGGKSSLANAALMCRSCNSRKGKRT